MKVDRLADERGHSFYIVDNVVIEKHLKAIGPLGLTVYNVLAFHANKHGQAWPSRKRLAEIIGCSTDTIDRAIARLIASGLLSKAARMTDDGQTSNVYTMRPTQPLAAAPPAAPVRPPQPHGSGAPLGVGAARIRPIEQDPLNKEYPSIVNETMDGAPVAPAGNLANGTGPAPAKTRTRRKATPRTPLQLGQGSTIYRDVVELTPNAAQRVMLDAAFEKHGERAMRDGLARWLAKGWSPKNVPGMVDFLDGGDKGRRADAKAEAFWASVQW